MKSMINIKLFWDFFSYISWERYSLHNKLVALELDAREEGSSGRGRGDPGRGVLRVLSDWDDQRILGSLKFAIPGFFCVGKFGKYFFVWLDLSRDFWEYSKQSEDLW